LGHDLDIDVLLYIYIYIYTYIYIYINGTLMGINGHSAFGPLI
jgi:hypothetical protein